MSGLGDATFVIDLDTTQLVQGSSKAKQTFQEMASSGLQSMQTVQVGADNVGNSVSKLKDRLETTKGSISGLIGPMTGLAASSASLYFGFDNLDKVSVRLERSQLALSRAQDAVKKLQDDGKTGTVEYQRALEALQVAQDRYNSQSNDMIQTETMLGLQFITLGTSTIPSVIKAVQALKITQEGFAVTLEATMPWLLAITAAILAWEEVIAPLIKQHYNLDLGIQDNIQKLVSQHHQLQDTQQGFGDYTNTLGAVDGSLATTTGSFNTLGSSISTTTGKLSDMEQAFQELLQGGQFSTQGTSLLSQNDAFTQMMSQIDQVRSIESDIQKLMDNHVDKQTAINMTMDHYLTALQEEAFQHVESNAQLEKKIGLLKQAVNQASQLVDLQKKAKVSTNAFGIPDTVFNSIASDLARRLGLTVDQVKESFNPGGAGSAFNQKLQDQWAKGIRDFGSTWEIMNQKISRNLPFYAQIGISIAGGGGGINTSSPVGSLKNDDFHNMLVQLVANAHMGFENYGRDKDFLRQAIDNGDALQQAQFEQHDSRWQMFYALRGVGLFTGDPNLSLEDNLANAEKAYNAIFTGLRPDVASALRAANEQSYSYRLYADARSPGIAVTRYNFEVPTKDALDRAIADSRFATEVQFQDILARAKTILGLDQKQVIGSLANDQTVNDIAAELEFRDRLAAASSGA